MMFTFNSCTVYKFACLIYYSIKVWNADLTSLHTYKGNYSGKYSALLAVCYCHVKNNTGLNPLFFYKTYMFFFILLSMWLVLFGGHFVDTAELLHCAVMIEECGHINI